MGLFDNVREQAENLAVEHKDKVEQVSDQGLDKAAGVAGGATGGKFDDQIQQGRDTLDEKIGDAGA